jgi:chemotaxis signal transduction protein
MEPDPTDVRSANSLLDRIPPPRLVDEWTARIAGPKYSSDAGESLALVVFRCTSQWFALSAHLFDRVCSIRPVRPIPFRTSDTFRGLVNLDGELSLCVSLPAILGLSNTNEPRSRLSHCRRLCLIRYQRERIAFEVDELLGHRKIPRSSFSAAPENLTATPGAHTESFCTLESKLIALLDTDKLSASLRRALSW